MRKIFMIFSCVFLFANTQAQTDSTKKKMFDHYLGIQANQLVKEVINLGSAGENNNPYLVTYGFFYPRWKLGMEFGVGFNYQTLKDEDSPVNRTSRINELFWRTGIGRKMPIGKIWTAGVALDFVKENVDDETESTSVTTGQTTTVSTYSMVSTNSKGNGGGIRLNLSANITKYLQVGTEATCYYMSRYEKQRIKTETTITSSSPGLNSFSYTDDAPKNRSFRTTVDLPVTIFLILKF